MKYRLVGLSLAGGALTSLAWTDWCTGLILLVSFVPFFIVGNLLFVNRKNYAPNAFFVYLLSGFVLFNIITLGWIKVATMAGAVTIIMGLSLLMSFTLWLAHIIRIKAGNTAGIISLFAFWTGYEFLSLNINFLTPWLNLGNGLSKDILFIQWYEVTGAAGGTVWILASNLLLTLFFINFSGKNKRRIIYLISWLLLIILPSVISITRYLSIEQNNVKGENVVIVQPNTDPYTEKFSIPFETQMKKVISMAEKYADSETSWIITPETTIDDPVNLDDLKNNVYIRMLGNLSKEFPASSIVTGMVTYRKYPASVKAPTSSAVLDLSSGSYIDYFNSALKTDTSRKTEICHKSKLVPGIELQFRYNPAKYLKKLLPGLGGTENGYGIQKERNCFTGSISGTRIAPIICYESVFGEYVTKYGKEGANAIFIITNDGWWKNTQGYKQHLWYASLRAIETRRPVIRSANTGVSCIINIRGERIVQSNWWEETALKGVFYPETRITPYVKYGDYLLRLGAGISIVILVTVFVAIPLKKKTKKALFR